MNPHPTHRARPAGLLQGLLPLAAMATIAAAAAGTMAAATTAAATTATAATDASATIVHPGQSIQAAIDRAPDRHTVIVEPGTYAENLLITKPVRLVGSGATLVPPGHPAPNSCWTVSPEDRLPGICVLGKLADVKPDRTPRILAYVEDVQIVGLRISGFPGHGVHSFATERMVVADAQLDGNAMDGAISLASHHTQFRNNRVHHNGHFGLTVEDAPHGNATIVGNEVEANEGVGILVRDSDGAHVATNSVTGNCAGILVLQVDIDEPTSALVEANRVRDNSRYCGPDGDGYPSMAGMGIALAGGVTGSTVRANAVMGNHGSDAAQLPGAGVLVIDTTALGGTAPHGNTVTANLLRGNAPYDVMVTGGTNRVVANRCTTSAPAGYCQA